MAINFPASPSVNQTYTFNGRTWTWNGVGWQATGSTGLTVYTKTDFTATAGQTSFSATYTVGFVDVFYNGSKLSTSEYTATTGSTVVLGTACAVGDIVETIAWTISSSFNPSLGSASATSLAIGGATIGTNALAVTGTTALSGLLTAAGGVSSTLVTDATSATTGSIITAGGISTQKALWVGTTSTLVGKVLVGETSSTPTAGGTQAIGIAGNIKFDSGGIIEWPTVASAAWYQYDSSGALVFQRAATEAARFDTSGNLLVGLTSSVASCRINIGSGSNGLYMFVGNGAAGQYLTNTSGTGNWQPVSFNVNGGTLTEVGSIKVVSSATQFNTSSDGTLKNILPDQRDVKALISGIEVVDFEWKAHPGTRTLGVIAQQVHPIFPDAISVPEDETKTWQADYSKLAPLALWGVKDLYAENEALKASIADLTTRLAALENK